jgi:hypothetical protein
MIQQENSISSKSDQTIEKAAYRHDTHEYASENVAFLQVVNPIQTTSEEKRDDYPVNLILDPRFQTI